VIDVDPETGHGIAKGRSPYRPQVQLPVKGPIGWKGPLLSKGF